MRKSMDGSQKQAVNNSSSLISLLKEEKKDFLLDRNKKQALANNPPPIAAIPLSSLHSLLKDDERSISGNSMESKKTTANRTDAWWNEKPQRPRNYMKHFQPLNASYTKKLEPPRDYGDVVTASNDEKYELDRTSP
jgi:hypothetical protein